MSIRGVDPGDREFGMQKAISGKIIERGSLLALDMAATELLIEWEKAREKYGFPDNDVPEWRISWYYVQKGDSE